MAQVSIIIPAYNSARYIRQTLESATAQDLPGIEVVLVDDGSSDNTVEIARSYESVRVITRANGGDAAARNTGFQEIRSEFLLFLDHDDLLHPSAVRTHLAAFSDNLDMVFGSNDLIDPEGRVTGHNSVTARRFSARDVILGMTPSFSQCMYRRSALERIGGFRDKVGSAADHDLNIRLLGFEERGLCHGKTVMSYRIHRGQQSASPIKLYTGLMAVVEEHLGPGGFMEEPVLLKAARRHWARYFGQFIPLEVLRLIRARRFKDASQAIGIYFGNAPATFVGTAQFAARRLSA